MEGVEVDIKLRDGRCIKGLLLKLKIANGLLEVAVFDKGREVTIVALPEIETLNLTFME